MTRFTVIADCGCNHGGDMMVARRMIREAAWYGVSYAKFQLYDVEEIRGYEERMIGEGKSSPYQAHAVPMEKLFDGIREAQLSIEQLVELREVCVDNGVEFLCTPFINPKYVDQLEALNVEAYKIRARDSENYALIDRALRTGKPVYISAMNLPVDHHYLWHPSIRWMLCIPRYPARLEDLELGRLQHFSGYSNHIRDLAAPLASAVVAREHGKAEWVIEVHVTLSHEMPTLDDAVSFDFKELGELVRLIRKVERMRVYGVL